MPCAAMPGMLAAVNGANMRVLVINLTSPEARGASIALLGMCPPCPCSSACVRLPLCCAVLCCAGFVNCIGRGFGPLLLDLYMTVLSIGRREALGNLLNLWLLSGALICLAARSLDRDEERVRAALRRIADEATGKSGGLLADSAASGASTSTSASSSFSSSAPMSSSAVNFRSMQAPQIGLGPLYSDRERSNKLPGYLL